MMLANEEHSILLGPVQTVRTEGFRVSELNGELVQTLEYLYLETYDANRANVERECRRADGSLWYRSVYSYDSAHRMTEELFFATEGSASRTLYRYDTEGRLAERVSLDTEGRLKEKKSYSYEADGRRIEEVTLKHQPERGKSYELGLEGIHLSFSLPKMHGYRVKSVFNIAGKPVEVIVYLPDGTEKQRVSYTYDKHGRLTRVSRVRAEGSFINKIRETMAGLISHSAPFAETVYQYDEAGRLLEQGGYEFGSLELKRVHHHDSRGNTIESAMLDSKSKLIERQIYEYEYDSYGNWTSQKVTRLVPQFKSKHTFVRRRTITYFQKRV